MAEATILGKRERNGAPKVAEESDSDDVGPQPAVGGTVDGDDEDDDVGPMPMPDNGSAPRKKRKGKPIDTCHSQES